MNVWELGFDLVEKHLLVSESLLLYKNLDFLVIILRGSLDGDLTLSPKLSIQLPIYTCSILSIASTDCSANL